MKMRRVASGSCEDHFLRTIRSKGGPMLLERGAEVLLSGVSIGKICESVGESGFGKVLRPKTTRDNIVSAEFEKWSRQGVKASALLADEIRGQARLDIRPHAGHFDMPEGLRWWDSESAIFVTSSGLRTPLHSDPYDGILAHVSGRKRFVFVHPEDSDRNLAKLKRLLGLRRTSGSIPDIYEERNTLLRSMRCFQGDLEPGDALFIPSRWLHDFESLDPTISLAVRFSSAYVRR